MVLPKGGDLTESIVKVLKLDSSPLPRKVIQRVQDALNLLRFRNAIGSFGKYDNDRKRACAILEYEAREQCGVQISMDKLAKAAYMRKAEFVQFHQTVGNFRDNMASRSETKTTTSSSSSTDKPKSAFSLQQKSSIDRLSVQLGAFVPNSSVVASQAQKLFRTVHTHLKGDNTTTQKSSHKRLHALQDLQRHQQAYEAACFFLVATNDRSNSYPKQRIARLSNDDGNDNKPLDLNTFLNATTHAFSKVTFETILDYVKELQEEIVHGGGNSNNNKSAKYIPSAATARMQGAVKRKRNDNRKYSLEAAEKQSRTTTTSKPAAAVMQSTTDLILQMAAEQHVEREEEDDNLPKSKRRARSSRDHERPQEQRYPQSPSFIELKRKIVQTACLKAKEEWNEKRPVDDENGLNSSDDSDTKSKWLDLAVQQALQHHGLL